MRSFVLVAALAGTASATPMTVTGEVIDVRSRWTADGDRIVTESTLRLADGSRRVILQAGGTVDGIGMRVIPSAPLLRPGDQADVELAGPWVRRVRALTPGALPFVRTTNDFGTPLSWASGCVFVRYDAAGTTHVEGTAEFAVMDGVFARWRGDTDQCSYLQFDIGAPVASVSCTLPQSSCDALFTIAQPWSRLSFFSPSSITTRYAAFHVGVGTA